MRKVRTAALALIVVLGSTAGFLGLSSAFRDHPRPGFGGSGRIVFGRVQLELDPTGGSSRSGREIWSMAVDGSDVRMVVAGDTSPTTPAWSPDGSRIAFLEQDPDADDLGSLRLSTSAPDGSDLTVVAAGLIEPMVRVVAWSPDGARIAVLDSRAHDLNAFDDYGIPLTEIAVYGLDGTRDRFVDVPGTAHGFTWWPDGQGFVVAASDARGNVDLVRVDLGGQVLGHLAEDVAPYPPAVPPGGDLVAFVRQGPPIGGSHVPVDDVWTVSPDGSDLTRVTDESGLKPALAWSSNGTRIVFANQTPDRCDIVSISPDGSDRTLVADRSTMGGCAEEISVNGSIPPSASPEPDVETDAGRDIGLGVPMCHIEILDGIDWYGDGTSGTAWTGARVTPDGRCPEENIGEYVVAADLDGDGEAEPGGMGFLSSCLFCHPYATTDLDADGVLELVVLEEGSSTPSFSIYEVSVPTSERSPGIYNLFVAPPGHPEARIRPGESLRILTGGDEGFAGWVGCDGRGGELILQITWRDHPVEGDLQEVHETDLALRNGIFQVVAGRDYELPVGAPVPRASDEPACGVDWQI